MNRKSLLSSHVSGCAVHRLHTTEKMQNTAWAAYLTFHNSAMTTFYATQDTHRPRRARESLKGYASHFESVNHESKNMSLRLWIVLYLLIEEFVSRTDFLIQHAHIRGAGTPIYQITWSHISKNTTSYNSSRQPTTFPLKQLPNTT